QAAARAAREDYAFHRCRIVHQWIRDRLEVDGRIAPARTTDTFRHAGARTGAWAGSTGTGTGPRPAGRTGGPSSAGGRGRARGEVLRRRLLVVGWRGLEARLLSGPPMAMEWSLLGSRRGPATPVEQHGPVRRNRRRGVLAGGGRRGRDRRGRPVRERRPDRQRLLQCGRRPGLPKPLGHHGERLKRP